MSKSQNTVLFGHKSELEPMHFAKDLKKGDAVEITGGIAYKAFKDEKGFTRRQASIIASYVEKIEYHRQGNLLSNEVVEAMDAVSE